MKRNTMKRKHGSIRVQDIVLHGVLNEPDVNWHFEIEQLFQCRNAIMTITQTGGENTYFTFVDDDGIERPGYSKTYADNVGQLCEIVRTAFLETQLSQRTI